MKRRIYTLPVINIRDGLWRGKHPIDDIDAWQREGHQIKRIIKIVKARKSFAYLLFFEPMK